ncbi:aryl-alcohol dehydrogenase-like predicted oxidoreductase [Rhodoligotrophos appendicifer]|uniref:aldo/keto reductase n=1 Tax=Rhodoligotrophos appendicifer TaxID=987056 RepID=UPI001184F1BE|nr:aldo/keto reductase [Rhodoligotrophos appendicifer]
MEIRNLGSSGLRVSLVGLGCNNFGGRLDLAATKDVIHAALDEGITLFDTADIYGGKGASETLMGEVLGDRRADIVLATKFGMDFDKDRGMTGASRRYIIAQVEQSLKRLKTDWIDLYQLHQPDPLTPIEETLRALDDLITQGKVRYIGCSNLAAWQVVEADWTAQGLGLNGFASCQDEYSLLRRGIEKELIPAIESYGLGLLPYFPLASGMLTGKYKAGEAPAGQTRFAAWTHLGERYMTEKNFAVVEKLTAFAAERNLTLLELAFSWLAANPSLSSVIAGATTPEQVKANARAIVYEFDEPELDEIDAITATP